MSKSKQRRTSARSSSTKALQLGATYSRQNQIPTVPRSRPKKYLSAVTRRASRGSKVILVVLAGLLFMYSLVLNSEPIMNVNGKLGRTAEYEQYIVQFMRGSPLNRLKFTAHTERLQSELLQQFPEIISSEVRIAILGKKPIVFIDTSSPLLVLESKGKRYIVADNGKNVGEQSSFTPRTLVVLADSSGIDQQIGQQVLRSDDMAFIRAILHEFTTKNREVGYLTISSSPREIVAKPADKPYEIKFFLDDDVYNQLGAYFAVEKTLGEGGLSPQKYIDVRSGDKVYWQ